MVKILIVEDNPHNMRLINQVLEDVSANIEITNADSGVQAITKAKDQSFDLVMMDIALPDMDGMQTASKLRDYPQFKETKFIATTAYAQIKDEQIFRVLFDDYISKPIDEDLLIEKVNMWIGDKL